MLTAHLIIWAPTTVAAVLWSEFDILSTTVIHWTCGQLISLTAISVDCFICGLIISAKKTHGNSLRKNIIICLFNQHDHWSRTYKYYTYQNVHLYCFHLLICYMIDANFEVYSFKWPFAKGFKNLYLKCQKKKQPVFKRC